MSRRNRATEEWLNEKIRQGFTVVPDRKRIHLDNDNCLCDSRGMRIISGQTPTNISGTDLYILWQQHKSVHKVGKLVGLSGQTVLDRINRAGHDIPKVGEWTPEQIEQLRKWYTEHAYRDTMNLDVLAKQFGKLRSNVCRKARQLGLSNMMRKRELRIPPELLKNQPAKYKTQEERSRACSEWTKTYLRKHGHPRGMLGKKHTPETLATIGHKTKAFWNSMSLEERSAFTLKGMKAREANGHLIRERPNATWKAGWREIAGQKIYFRSRWEFNYAVFLEHLRIQGSIAKWEHEPETFWFEKILRGCRSYMPDFRVTENDGSVVYHEVKGWMDDRSKTKIKRMAKYYPTTKLIIIGKDWFLRNVKKLSWLSGWEKQRT